jgi:hypothetical protein
MRRHDHRATCVSIEIDRLHDRLYNEYQAFSAASVRNISYSIQAVINASGADARKGWKADVGVVLKRWI